MTASERGEEERKLFLSVFVRRTKEKRKEEKRKKRKREKDLFFDARKKVRETEFYPITDGLLEVKIDTHMVL
jgi:hypothetical protein